MLHLCITRRTWIATKRSVWFNWDEKRSLCVLTPTRAIKKFKFEWIMKKFLSSGWKIKKSFTFAAEEETNVQQNEMKAEKLFRWNFACWRPWKRVEWFLHSERVGTRTRANGGIKVFYELSDSLDLKLDLSTGGKSQRETFFAISFPDKNLLKSPLLVVFASLQK